jgi:hypothetical protein
MKQEKVSATHRDDHLESQRIAKYSVKETKNKIVKQNKIKNKIVKLVSEIKKLGWPGVVDNASALASRRAVIVIVVVVGGTPLYIVMKDENQTVFSGVRERKNLNSDGKKKTGERMKQTFQCQC